MIEEPRCEAEPSAAEPVGPVPLIGRALSRHTRANSLRFEIRAEHLNAWCRLPGSPFSEGLLLLPNHPALEPPLVSMGPIDGEDADTVTCLFVSPDHPEHGNRLVVRVRVLDDSGRTLDEGRLVLGHGDHGALSLHFSPPMQGRLRLAIDVWFAHFVGTPEYGSVKMRYLATYADNELMRLFNVVGSDKGSEVSWGEGVPHFYALAYHSLLAALREQRFDLLEIGLDTAGQRSGEPTDAPSLRAWREYLPQARLFGYDVNDFGFFAQRDTHIFRGDQSSPADLRRFLHDCGSPGFQVVIDDGSHVPSHQQIALAALFERVAPSGLYVIEDLSWQPYDESPRTLDVLEHYRERGTLESPFIAPADARRLEVLISDVDIHRPNDSALAVITRKDT